MMSEKPTGLALLRMPFPAHQISKLPKPTKAQTDAVRADYKAGIRCLECGGWHHPKVVHLDYVGHAALTDRLLDADPNWNWEPLAYTDDGQPCFDSIDGLWIKLTVCGVTRLGYGHAGDKTGGDAVKEVIGDCIRNAAMRFGGALGLWHKGGNLHQDWRIESAEEGAMHTDESQSIPSQAAAKATPTDAQVSNMTEAQIADWCASISAADKGELEAQRDAAYAAATAKKDRGAYRQFQWAYEKRKGSNNPSEV